MSPPGGRACVTRQKSNFGPSQTRTWDTATNTSGTAPPRPGAEAAGTCTLNSLLAVSAVATSFPLTRAVRRLPWRCEHKDRDAGRLGQAWVTTRSRSTSAVRNARRSFGRAGHHEGRRAPCSTCTSRTFALTCGRTAVACSVARRGLARRLGAAFPLTRRYATSSQYSGAFGLGGLAASVITCAGVVGLFQAGRTAVAIGVLVVALVLAGLGGVCLLGWRTTSPRGHFVTLDGTAVDLFKQAAEDERLALGESPKADDLDAASVRLWDLACRLSLTNQGDRHMDG